MDILQLVNRVKSGEDSETQFKERIDSPDSLASEICAFANSSGDLI